MGAGGSALLESRDAFLRCKPGFSHPLGFTPSKCVVNNAFSPCAAAGAGCGYCDSMVFLGEPSLQVHTVPSVTILCMRVIPMIVLLFLCNHLFFFGKLEYT
jgi:hypothetical protein